jgi:ribosomal protein S18 acetylase RimI-like enzyme
VASSLRSFRPEDRETVLELSRRALNRPAEQVGNPIWATRDELESELSNWDVAPEETLLVDEEDGQVVGFGGVEISTGWEHADLFGPLIAPAYQGQKLGTELLDAAIDLARGHGVRVLIGSMGARNVRGRMLLEHAGFHERGAARAVFRLKRADHRPVAADGPGGATVRRGTPEDLRAAIQLYHECFPRGVFPDQAWSAAIDSGFVWLAEEAGGRPLAILDIDPSDHWAYHIGVVETERSRGLGGFLLSHALTDYWASHPDQAVGLAVEADNLPSLRLLRRQGFAPWLVLQSYELQL